MKEKTKPKSRKSLPDSDSTLPNYMPHTYQKGQGITGIEGKQKKDQV